MNVVVYTSNLAHYDHLRPVTPEAIEPGVRYVCFSDLQISVPAPWELAPIYAVSHSGWYDIPRSARGPKILPHIFFPYADASIYHDANFQMQVPPSRLLAYCTDEQPLACWPHPGRSCVYDEAKIVAREGLDDTNVIQLQMDRYRKRGLPEQFGLWACGLLMRRHTSEMRRFNEAWWYELMNYARRDQLGFPYAVYRSAWRPVTIDEGAYYKNPFFAHQLHAASAWAHKHPVDPDIVWQLQTLQRLYVRDPDAWKPDILGAP